jgi:hypothetical protein
VSVCCCASLNLIVALCIAASGDGAHGVATGASVGYGTVELAMRGEHHHHGVRG